ncbi:MAG: DUF3365 domain-containing protein [Hyphomicrobium sp.]|jgi:hypothetical protein|nr:DUF3365 domain-containing protein [Hyphomicrobium sp.]
MNKRFTTLVAPLAAVLMFSADMARSDSAADLEPYAAKARAAVKTMGGALQTKLKEALAADGPIAAVQVCKTVAPEIAKEQSKAAGMTIRRTALKVRNPDNAPDGLERKVLEDFAARLAAGADANTLEHVEEVTGDGKTIVRYFKAIPTAAAPCLVCHGSAVSGELKETIDKLYPSDQATGFKEGDLRGAFSVTMDK